MSDNTSKPDIKGILFDLDGTLLDTAPDLVNALNHVLNKHGYSKPDYQTARAEVSHGATALLKLGFGDDYDKFDALTIRNALLDFYYDNLAIDTDLFDGYAEVLTQFKAKNIPWGIVTNKPAFLTFPLMQDMENKRPILKDSQCLIAADSYATRKPHAVGLLHAAAKLKLDPKNIAYIGDSFRDIWAGQFASMYTVGVEFGYIGREDSIESWNADKVISTPSQLLELL